MKFKHIIIFLLICLFWGLIFEISSYYILCSMGANPFDKQERYLWGRRINGNYGSANVPNFKWDANDGKNNFKKGVLLTDSNSLISDLPTHIEKTPGLIRIFITGGSAAFGSIQNREATNDNTYPSDVYTYNSSIAGILKSKLESSFPQNKFEVVNCAIVRHGFQQNYAQYMSSLHIFKPDILINIDGYNDSYYFLGGEKDAANYVEQDVDQLLELEANARNKVFPLSVRLVNLLLDKYTDRMTNSSCDQNKVNYSPPAYSDYELIKNDLISNSNGLLWLASSFEKQLQTDSVYSIFCLQPILSRRLNQKPLSELEKKFLLNTEKLSVAQLSSEIVLADSVKIGKSSFLKLSDHIYGIRNITYGYFFDDFLSPALDSIVTNSNGDFIDFNKTITKLKSTDEFYVDYCHLTPFANDFMATLLSEKIKKHLLSKK